MLLLWISERIFRKSFFFCLRVSYEIFTGGERPSPGSSPQFHFLQNSGDLVISLPTVRSGHSCTTQNRVSSEHWQWPVYRKENYRIHPPPPKIVWGIRVNSGAPHLPDCLIWNIQRREEARPHQQREAKKLSFRREKTSRDLIKSFLRTRSGFWEEREKCFLTKFVVFFREREKRQRGFLKWRF